MDPAPSDATLTDTSDTDTNTESARADIAATGLLAPMSPGRRTAFQVLSATTAPVWLAMILFPRARVTRRLVALATPLSAALGVAYTALLARAMLNGDSEPPRFDDPDSLRAGLTEPDAFLAGWTHYLAFDLYVGRHIWSAALERGRTDRIALLLTWMAGPLGLTLHLARNAVGTRRS